MAEERPNYFDSLAPELMRTIFRYLDEDFEWLQNARWKMSSIPLVCKRFKQQLYDDPLWTERISCLKVSIKIPRISSKEPKLQIKIENAKGTIHTEFYNSQSQENDYSALNALNLVRIEELLLEFSESWSFDRRMNQVFGAILFSKCSTVSKLSLVDAEIFNISSPISDIAVIKEILRIYGPKQSKVQTSLRANFLYFSDLLLMAPNLNSLHLHIRPGGFWLQFSEAVKMVKNKFGTKGTFTLKWNVCDTVPLMLYWLKKSKEVDVTFFESVETDQKSVRCVRDQFVMNIDFLT